MSALRKVLVVDDDPVVGKSFNRVLSDKGYIVVTAEDGYDALMKLKAEKYDVVFTDIKMPGMDGLEVAERVKARQPWVPVVIVTGYGSKASEERARAAGVADFLRKPLSPDMIEHSAAEALRGAAPEPAAAPPPAAAVEAAPAEAAPVAVAAAGEAAKPNLLKNMALFLAAPFVGLVYAVLLPFVGIGMLAWFAGKALYEQPRAREALRMLKFTGEVALAPLAGLAFVLVFPFAAIVLLGWTGVTALRRTRPSE